MTYLDIYDIQGSGKWDDLKKSMTWYKVIVAIVVILLIIYFVGAGVNDWDWHWNWAFKKKVKSESATDSEVEPEAKTDSQSVVTPIAVPAEATVAVPEEAPVAVPEEAPVAVSEEAPAEESNNGISSFSNKEPFTNDLPYQLAKQTMTLDDNIDYNDMLQKMSLDKSVMDQHKQYVTDRNKITSTASFVPARSDTQDVVTTWGLTKPKYIQIDPSAREIPSQDPEQGSKPVTLRWN